MKKENPMGIKNLLKYWWYLVTGKGEFYYECPKCGALLKGGRT